MSKKKAKRGFAAMSPEQRKAIASKGGRAAQRRGTGHRWTKDEAVAAGAKGGRITQKRGTGNRFDSESGAKAARKAHAELRKRRRQ